MKSSFFYFRKTKRILIFLLLWIFCFNVVASPISLRKAKSIAAQLYISHGGAIADTSFDEIGSTAGFENLYIFVSRRGKGFVILSADDCAQTLLGISTENDFSLPLPPHVEEWLQDYEQQIEHLRAKTSTKKKKTGPILRSGSGEGEEYAVVVGPLLETQWNQSPFYNEQCPTYQGQHCVTGCVATAMAQIMRYWKYPYRGTGSNSYNHTYLGTIAADFNTTYDWEDMPVSLSSTQQTGINAVAKLMYHCGVSVNMNYGTGGSSANTSKVLTALKTYFSYSNAGELKYKTNFNDDGWKTLLRSDLDAGRPILYSGNGGGNSMGHAFVCDGYDSDGAFHFNWGWGGSHDGYYHIGNLRPGGGGIGSNNDNNYSESNCVLIGVEPLSPPLVLNLSNVELSRWGDSIVAWVRSSSYSSNWTASSDANWLTLSRVSGQGGCSLSSVTIYASRNTSGQTRTGHITITHNGQQRTITITQKDATVSPDGTYGESVGSGSGQGFSYGTHLIIRPENFGNFDVNQMVTSVQFRNFSTTGQKKYVIKIYENCDFNSELANKCSRDVGSRMGRLVYSQVYNATNDGLQNVTLDTPYQIPSTHTFWIAIQFLCTQTAVSARYVPMQNMIPYSNYPIADYLSKNYLRIQPSTSGDTCIWLNYSYTNTDGTSVLQASIEYLFNFTIESRSLPQYTITTACSPSNGGNITGGGSYTSGSTATLRATPNGDYRFVRWNDNNTSNPRTITVNSNATYTAYFEAIPYTITTLCNPANAGNVTGGGSYTSGSTATLRATPNSGYRFVRWSDGNTSNPRTITVNGNAIHTAYFEEVTICQDITKTIDTSACDSLLWRNFIYSSSGQYSKRLQGAVTGGCDSVLLLNLTINHPSTGIDNQSACYSYQWHGTRYTESINGVTYHTINSKGCDSTAILHLTIHGSSSSTERHTACNSFTWHGRTYSSSTTDTYRYRNSAGCDSIITLNLTILNSISDTVTVLGCDSLVWQGVTYHRTTAFPPFHSTSANGCDSSTSIILIINHASSGIETLSACDSLIWHGSTYTSSTNTPTHVTRSSVGCDSIVTLHLTINHSSIGIDRQRACYRFTWHGTSYNESTNSPTYQTTNAKGCDSTAVLHLTINQSSYSTETRRACNSFTWHEKTYYNDTTDIYRTRNVAGCDSTITLYLTIDNTIRTTDEHSACDSFTWHGTTYYTSTQTPTFTGQSTTGCDSIVTLHLNVGHPSLYIEQQTACDSFTWHNVTYYANTTTPTYQTNNSNGCDSTTVLHLTINHSTTGIETQVVCYRLNWHGHIYTNSTDTVTHHGINAKGCDSTTTLHLTILPSTTGSDTRIACDSLIWNGTTYYNSTNTPSYHTTNKNGCDSTITLNLTIKHSTTANIVKSACDRYSWRGVTYTSSTNTPSFTITNAAGCDSIIVLNLTINSSKTISMHDSACINHLPYTFGGQIFSNAGRKTIHDTTINGCDSTTTLILSVLDTHRIEEERLICSVELPYDWNNHIFYAEGERTVNSRTIHNCDSIIKMKLIVHNESVVIDSVTACDKVVWKGTTYTSSTTTPKYVTTDSWGCDSIVNLHLDIHYTDIKTTSKSICRPYTWRHNLFAQSGTYSDTLNNRFFCDSILILNLTITPVLTANDTQSACEKFVWNGQTYYESTSTPTFRTSNSDHCDSITTLILTIKQKTTYTDIQTACDSLIWNNTTYRVNNNTDTYTTTNSVGCDSIVYLHLTIRHSTYSNDTARGCGHVSWGRQYITSDTILFVKKTNVEQCDSIIGVKVLIHRATEETIHQSACDQVRWNQMTFFHDTTIVDTIMNHFGCDSIRTAYLHILHSTTATADTIVCDTFSYNGQFFLNDSIITSSHTASNNCDSIRIIHLLIHRQSSSLFDSIVCDSLQWNGHLYSTSITLPYRRLQNEAGCDSIISMRVTIQNEHPTRVDSVVCDSLFIHGHTYNTSGTYSLVSGTTHMGCDSSILLNLNIKNSSQSDTFATACDNFMWYGVLINNNDTVPRTIHKINHVGCDSTINLHLSLYYNSANQTYDTACIKFEWNGQQYSNDTTITEQSLSIHGCDSLIRHYIYINHPSQGTEHRSFCDSIDWGDTILTNDTVLSTSGLTNHMGCDSIHHLHLHLKHSSMSELFVLGCNDSIIWRNDIYKTPGVYQNNIGINFSGCDSTELLHLSFAQPTIIDTNIFSCAEEFIWRGYTFIQSGIYQQPLGQNISGCDSIARINLTLQEKGQEEYVDADSSYLWHNRIIYTSGTYTDTLISSLGCDSISILHLAISTIGIPYISETNNPYVFCREGNIVVRNAENRTLYLYDIIGHQLFYIVNTSVECLLSVPSSGTYIVKTVPFNKKQLSTHKIIVIK